LSLGAVQLPSFQKVEQSRKWQPPEQVFARASTAKATETIRTAKHLEEEIGKVYGSLQAEKRDKRGGSQSKKNLQKENISKGRADHGFLD